MSRQRLTPEMAERLGLSQQVVNELVTEAVVIQGAAKEGRARERTTRSASTIQQIREFQEDGRFSRDEYLKVLKQIRHRSGRVRDRGPPAPRAPQDGGPDQAGREGVRRGAPAGLPPAATSGCAPRGRYADVKPADGRGQVADADLEPYVKAHQAQFTPARAAEAPVRDPQPQEASRSPCPTRRWRRTTRSMPPSSRSRSACARPTCSCGCRRWAAARRRTSRGRRSEDVIQRAKAGEDFAKLAREISEDKATAAQGGDLGFVGAGELVRALRAGGVRAQEGRDLAAPVRTPFGYHAIKVLDVAGGRPGPAQGGRPQDQGDAPRAERSEQAAGRGPTRSGHAAVGEGLPGRGRQLGARGPRGRPWPRRRARGHRPRRRPRGGGLPARGGRRVEPAQDRPPATRWSRSRRCCRPGVPPLAEIRDRGDRGHQARAGGRARDGQGQGAGGGGARGRSRRGGQEGGRHQRRDRLLLARGAAARRGRAAGDGAAWPRSRPRRARSPTRSDPRGRLRGEDRWSAQPADPRAFDLEREELAKQVLEQKRASGVGDLDPRPPGGRRSR